VFLLWGMVQGKSIGRFPSCREEAGLGRKKRADLCDRKLRHPDHPMEKEGEDSFGKGGAFFSSRGQIRIARSLQTNAGSRSSGFYLGGMETTTTREKKRDPCNSLPKRRGNRRVLADADRARSSPLIPGGKKSYGGEITRLGGKKEMHLDYFGR